MFTNTSLLASVFIGGLLISLLSTTNTVYIQKEAFQPKGAARDFFIGALLVTFLYQLIPDTITDFGGFLTDVKLPSFATMQKGGYTSAYTGNSSGDFDLQVGVPRF
jgi:hypothetical protein